jgi:hypothetical protein
MSTNKAADLIEDLADVADELAGLLLDPELLPKGEVDALTLELTGIIPRLQERKERLEKMQGKPRLAEPPRVIRARRSFNEPAHQEPDPDTYD